MYFIRTYSDASVVEIYRGNSLRGLIVYVTTGAGYTTVITDLVDDRRTNTVLSDQADGEHRNLLRGAYLFEQVQVKCIVVVAEVDDRVRVVRVMVQSYPVEGRPAVGHAARYGVRSAPVYGRHRAGDIRVRNAWKNDKVFL